MLLLEKPLSFNKKLNDQDVTENGAATFECALSKPGVNAEWLFNGKPIGEILDKDSYVISEVDGVHRLHIPKCSLKHQGNYSFRVPSENLESKARLGVDGMLMNFDELKFKNLIFLCFSEAGADFVNSLEAKEVNEGDFVEYKIEVSKPDARVRWFINGERIVSDENYEVIGDNNSNIRCLRIKKAKLGDNGTVKCSLYEKNIQTTLKVKGKKYSPNCTVKRIS